MSYKDITQTVSAHTDHGTVIVHDNLALIPYGDGQHYEYLSNVQIWDKVDDDIRSHVQSYQSNAKALSLKDSGISTFHFSEKQHIEIFLKTNNEKVSIDALPVHQTPSGFRAFVRTKFNHGSYLAIANDDGKNVVLNVFRDDGTYVPIPPSVATDHKTLDRFDYIDVSNVPLDNCPVVSDKFSEMLSSVPVYHVPRSLPSEMLSNIIFALCQSVTNRAAVLRIGSCLRNICGIEPSFVRALWSELLHRTNVEISLEDVRPGKSDATSMLLHWVWLHNTNIHANILRRFGLKRNMFNPDDETKYFDKESFANETKTIYDVTTWINRSIAYIVEGGDGFWITKNFDEHGNMYIKRVRDLSKDLKQSYSFVCDSLDYSMNKITVYKLYDIVKAYRSCVAFEKLSFLPHSGKTTASSLCRDHFNTFVEYPVKYNPSWQVDLTLLEPLFYHIRHVLANNDDLSFEYIVRWMAHIIQKPQERTGVCLTFTSAQGTGKGIWWEWFGERIIGKNQYLLLDSIDVLFQRFNSEQEGKLLTILDEAQLYSVQHKNNDRFKSVLTERTLRVEPKGLPVYTVTNYNNFVMLTNHELPTRIDISDRRHACFQVSTCYMRDKAYFDRLARLQNRPDVIENFYHFLEDLPINDFRPQYCIPETRLKKDLRLASTSTPLLFLIDLVQGEYISSDMIPNNTPAFVPTQHMYMLYKDWVEATAYKPDNKIQFSRAISNNLLLEPVISRNSGTPARGYITSIKQLKDAIQTHIGCNVFE